MAEMFCGNLPQQDIVTATQHLNENLVTDFISAETNKRFRDNTFMESSNGTLGGGDFYSVLYRLP
jgi:hypothetical protein